MLEVLKITCLSFIHMQLAHAFQTILLKCPFLLDVAVAHWPYRFNCLGLLTAMQLVSSKRSSLYFGGNPCSVSMI